MLPSIWGSSLWTLLHALMWQLPQPLHPHTRFAAIAMLQSLQLLLPCGDCQGHYAREVAASPPSAAPDLALWLHDLHNRVNVRLGKPVVSVGAARLRFLGPSGEAAAQCHGEGGV
jgi:hypothetical protein